MEHSCSPIPDDLIAAAKQAFEPQMSPDDAKDAGALDIAAKHLADGMWEAKPLLIELSRTKIAQALGPTGCDLYVIGARPAADASARSRDMLSAPDTERTVGRANLLLLEGIRAINQRIAAMKADGTITDDVVSPGMKGQLSHQIEEVLRSVLMRNPLTINADFIRALAASAAPADQARLAAFWKLYPDLRQMADSAALDRPVITWERPDGSTASSQNDVLTDVPGRPSLPRPSDLDESEPWKSLAFEGEKFVQTLDRAAGTLTLTTIQGRESFSKTVRFQPWKPDDGEAALRQQDASLRFLEEFSVSHFWGMSNLPHELHLDAGQIKAGDVLLAQRVSGAWSFHSDAILRASHDADAGWASESYLLLEDWSLPTTSMATTASTADPLDRLLIDLQIGGDPIIQDLTEAWVAKNPDKSIWIQWDREESSRVVHGAGLEKRIGPGTEIKLTIHGHGRRLWNGGGMTVHEDHDPESLAMAAKTALHRHGITQRVNEVVLAGCMLESGFGGKSFGRPFLEIAHEEGLVTDSAEVTTFKHLLWPQTTPRALRTTIRHLAAPRRIHAPNVTLIFKRDKDSGAITVEDKYPPGRLRNTLLALGKTLVKAGINPLTDPAPAELVDAVHTRLKTLYPGIGDAHEHAGALREASRLIAEGLWRQRPRKFQESLRALDRIPLARSERSWQWPLALERAMGLVGDTILLKDLIAQQPDSLLISRTEGALMQGLEAGLPVLERLSPDTGPAAGRPALGRQTLALVKAELSGRPYVVELESLDQLSRDTPAGRAGLDVLEAVHGTVMQLADRGVMEAPIYLTRDSERGGAGWESHDNGVLIHRGDLLPVLLPDRKDRIERLRKPDLLAESTPNDDGLEALHPVNHVSANHHGKSSPAVLTDKYPLADADGYGLTAVGVITRDEARHPRPGQADRLSELWSALASAFATGEISTLDGQAPEAVVEAVKKRLASVFSDDFTVDGDALSGASRSLADGLWSRDPAKLREATLALSRLYGERGPMVARVTWSDLPMGLIDKVRLPGKLLWKHLKAADMPLADVALLCGMESAVRAMEALPGQAARNPVRRALARQTLALVQAVLSGRPFTIDADAVAKIGTFMEASGGPLEHAVLRVLDVMHGAAMQLARKGLVPAPVYLADTAPDGTSGWQKYPDGSLVHRGDLLSTLLPRRKQRIEQLQTPADVKVNDKAALPGLPEPASLPDSLLDHAVRLAGHDVPAAFLASLGGEIDGKPITGDLLRSIADDPSDPALGLKIDPDLFEQWAKLVPEKVDAGIAARARALGQWLAQRKAHASADSAFTGEASAQVEALAARLTAAAGKTAKSSDADMLKALRGEDAKPSSLFREIFGELDETTRAGFEEWMARVGIEADDLLKMAPSSPGQVDLDPVEKTIAEIGRQAAQGEDLDIDFEKIQGVNKTNALASLQEIGLVKVDAQGVRLDSERLKALIDSEPGVKLAYADRALRKLPEGVYRSLWQSAPQEVRTFMDSSRNRPNPPSRLAKWMDKMDGTVDVADTVLGIYQLMAHGKDMSPAALGLTATQTTSIIVSPLAMLLGRKLSMLSVASRFKVLRALSVGLAGGVANVVMAGIGAAACAVQWNEFFKSGQSTDSPAFKSLVVNTVMTSVSVALAITGAAIGVKVALAGGAAAIAGTALGVASAVMAKVAAPIAVVMFVANAITQAVLWFDEFGQYVRDSTSSADLIAAAIAKAFGFSTDVTLRAETEKMAREAVARHAANLKAQFRESLEFEADMLTKQGYSRFHLPETEHTVRHATFKHRRNYTFSLQEGHAMVKGISLHQPKHAPLNGDTAWLLGGPISLKNYGQDLRGEPDAKRQLFQLGRASDLFVYGSTHDDIFQLTRPEGVYLAGDPNLDNSAPGKDEIQIDADGSDVSISSGWLRSGWLRRGPDGKIKNDGAGTTKDDVLVRRYYISFPGIKESRATDLHRISIKNAGKVDLSGSEGDERFDISSKTATISGLGGNNTYLLRSGNQIVVTSNDIAVWTREVSDASIDVGDASAKLMLKIDALHENVGYRREGQHLMLLIAGKPLTLKRYFERLDPPAVDTNAEPRSNPLVLVDAVGTLVTLVRPLQIGKNEVNSRQLDKHVMLGATPPASRRSLSADDASNRYYLVSGSGEFRTDPMTSIDMNVILDIPVERLRHVAEGDDLLIVETPPADAKTDFTPMRLRLTGQRNASGEDGQAVPNLWANDKDKNLVALVIPEHDEAADGPMGFKAASQPDLGKEETAAKAVPGQGTEKDDEIDARELATGSVLSGGQGADIYWITAGQSLVIDNLATDGMTDVLKVEGITRDAFLGGLRMSRSDGDLVIDLSGSRITVRDHAAKAQARHLLLQIGLERFVLPVIAGDRMVHLSSSDAAEIAATSPGAHVIASAPGMQWRSSPPRRVWMAKPERWTTYGHALVGWTDDDESTTVMLQDYHRAPEAWVLLDHKTGEEIHPDEKKPVREGVERIATDLRNRKPSEGADYTSADVQAYLEMKGMPREVAAAVRSKTFQQLQRVRELLALTEDHRDWRTPAAFIDSFAASDLKLTLSDTEMLRHLAARRLPWAYGEQVLRRRLSVVELQAFEAWLAEHVTGGINDPAAPRKLGEFIKAMDGEVPTSSAGALSLVAAILQLKGRPAAVARDLARAMLAVGTMDDGWISAMRLAGVHEYEVLKRLWADKISADDVVLSNANRRHYEEGERSAWISVSSPTFKSPDKLAYRYLVRHYLKLDARGRKFITAHEVRRPGVTYDLEPGQVLDAEGQWGEAPVDKDSALIKRWKERDEESPPDLVEQARRNSLLALKARTPLALLYLQGSIDGEEVNVPGTWEKRSHPMNLVDGRGLLGDSLPEEVTSWRPGTLAVGPDKSILFEFTHPVALASLKLGDDHPPQIVSLSSKISRIQAKQVARWKVEAIRKDGQRVRVSEIFETPHGSTANPVLIDTKGVPYGKYEIVGVDGEFPDGWFSEVRFTTAEAGGNLLDRLQQAGFTSEEARSLALRGIQSDEQIAHAGELRRQGGLPWSLIADDVEKNSRLSPTELDLLGQLRLRMDRWSHEDMLAAVRQRSDDQRVQILDDFLEFDRISAEVPPSLKAQLVSWLTDAWNPATRDSDKQAIEKAAADIIDTLMANRHVQRPPGLMTVAFGAMKGKLAPLSPAMATVDASAWIPAWLRDHFALTPKAGNAGGPSASVEVRVVLDIARRFLDALDTELVAGNERGRVLINLAARYLQLAALSSVAHGHELHVRPAPGQSARTSRLNDMVDESGIPGELQRHKNWQVLDVVVSSFMPPVHPAKPWTERKAGDATLYVAPAETPLPAAYAAAKAGQPVARLVSAGFSQEDAKALFAGGVTTLQRVDHAIELRKLFNGQLPLATLVEDVRQHPSLSPDQLVFIAHLKELHWRNAQVMLDAVRKGPPPGMRAILVGDLLSHGKTSALMLDEERIDSYVELVGRWMDESWGVSVQDEALKLQVKQRIVAAVAQGNFYWLGWVLNLAGTSKLAYPGPSSVTESTSWAPEWLSPYASLAPLDGPKREIIVDAWIPAVLDALDDLLETIANDLRTEGKSEEEVALAIGPRYFHLATVRAAITGQQLRVHIPLGPSIEDQLMGASAENALPGLQVAKDLGVLDVTIASHADDSPERTWTTLTPDGGKSLHVSTNSSLLHAWREGQTAAAEPIQGLIAAGYSEDDAYALHEEGVDSRHRVWLAAQLRGIFGEQPLDAVVKMVHSPSISAGIKQIEHLARRGQISAKDLLQSLEAEDDARLPGRLRASILGAQLWDSTESPLLSDEILFTLREQVIGWLNESTNDFFPVSRAVSRFLIRIASADWIFGPDALANALVYGSGTSFVHDDSLSVESSDWVPDRLGPYISLIPGNGGAKVPKPDGAAYVMLRIVKRFYDALESELLKKGHGSDEVAQAMDPLYLKLEAMRASVTGMRLDLQEPQGDSAEAVRVRALISNLRAKLERAHELKLLDFTSASSVLSEQGVLSIALGGGKEVPFVLDRSKLGLDLPQGSIRQLQIQGKGRSMDLSQALTWSCGEIVVLPEARGVRRMIDLRGKRARDLLPAFDGDDLLLFNDGDDGTPLIRVRQAAQESSVSLWVDGRYVPLPANRKLTLPVLALQGTEMTLSRDGSDLIVRSKAGTGEQRLSGFFTGHESRRVAEASQDTPLLLVRQKKDATWRTARVSDVQLLQLFEHQRRGIVEVDIGDSDSGPAGPLDGGKFKLHGQSPADLITGHPGDHRTGARGLALRLHEGMAWTSGIAFLTPDGNGRLPAITRVSMLIDELFEGAAVSLIDEPSAQAYETQVIGWLNELCGSRLETQSAATKHFARRFIQAAQGDTNGLIGAMASSWLIPFQIEAPEPVPMTDFVPARLAPYVSVISGNGAAQLNLLDARVCRVLDTFKRLLEAIHADRLKAQPGDATAAQPADPALLRLVALYAAATEQRIEVREPQGDAAEAVRMRALLAELRPALERARQLKLLDVSFSTGGAESESESESEPKSESESDSDSVKESEADSVNEPEAGLESGPESVSEAPATEAPADPVAEAGSIQKAAELLKQGIASQPDSGSAGISSFAPPVRPPSTPLLTATT